ncbi:hypothetical protein X758_30580 [Mesorhizobium sp. LSHC416B00]|nr:hypothetical protein X758_30580 [Mesorhizobium sp. LSHC416B00]
MHRARSENIRGMWTSQSDMLCIRHCGPSNRAEGDASTAENIFFIGRRLGALLGKGDGMRFEGRCTDGQN